LFRNHRAFEELFGISGYAFVSPKKIDVAGATPLIEELKELALAIEATMDKDGVDLFETDELSKFDPRFENMKDLACGVLAVRTSENEQGLLILLRPEILNTIQWGGDPKKTLDTRNYKGIINPRQSFETWTEVVRGHSRPWRKFQRDGLVKFRNLIFELLINKEKLIKELTERLGR